ncbi:NAD(P)/FAD-dependent oxidoreductase [Mangrovimicrobium sediminis]|nr:tryptophan 7-halogenase [Haliea sp. SAOS-164]
MNSKRQDVIIAGGGLAGLGLARQLITQRPDLDIVVLERNRFPVDETVAKVGESTVEVASRYFCHTLELGEHFHDSHLQKFGLRCFFGAPQDDFSQHDELGVSQRFPLPTFQLERGAMENHLYRELLERGVRIDHGVQIQSIDMSPRNHRLSFVDGEQEREYSGRWLVDCTGRYGLVKRQLGLARPSPHRGNAIWFRVDKTIKIDEWSGDAAWRERMVLDGKRWLSTNHLMGPGYWVWIIPLGSGATSIGIVMDDQAFETAAISDYPGALAWLSRNHPQCAAALEGSRLLDFVALRDYSYDCKQMFSDEGWGLTGESGVFSDPFYSPGSDFIALANEILSHLIIADSRGTDIAFETRALEFFYTSFFSNTLSLYTDQYGGFGDRTMMSVKLVWDYSFYWGVLALLYYKGAVADIQLLRRINSQLLEAISLNAQMQGLLRERASQRLVQPAAGVFVDQYQIPVLHQLIGQLHDESLSLEQALPVSVALLRELVPAMADLLGETPQRQVSDSERQHLGDFRQAVLA